MEPKSVAILLAVYEPNVAWLCELLDSLNTQTYAPIRLYVRDDASPTFPQEELRRLLDEHAARLSPILMRNEHNLGSNATFEQLVRDCREDYIAFCDQDDVWNPDKVENTVRLFEESPLSPTLVCTNVSVIDGEGNEISDRIDHHRRRHVFARGEDLAETLIYRNFVMGCTVLAERERVLSYLPFPSAVVHDHYLAFRASVDGALDFIEKPQMRYRVYGGNQTGVMTGVSSKEDYRHRRIDVFDDRVRAFSVVGELPSLKAAHEWSVARVDNFERKKGSFRSLWRLRHRNRTTSLFELLVLRMPTPLFRFAVRLVQKRIL